MYITAATLPAIWCAAELTAPRRAMNSAMNVNAVTSTRNVRPIGSAEGEEVALVAQARPRPVREYAIARVGRRPCAPYPGRDADDPVDDRGRQRAAGRAHRGCAPVPEDEDPCERNLEHETARGSAASSRAAATRRWCSSQTAGTRGPRARPTPRSRGSRALSRRRPATAGSARGTARESGTRRSTTPSSTSVSHMPWRTCSPISASRPAPRSCAAIGETASSTPISATNTLK